MTKTEQAIKDAIEGGWDEYYFIALKEFKKIAPLSASKILQRIAFSDPLFWQCLGRTRRWGIKEKLCQIDGCPILTSSKTTSAAHYHIRGDKNKWLSQATRYFQDYAMKGREAEEFFREIE